MEEKLDGLYVSPIYVETPLLVKDSLTVSTKPCFICGSIIEQQHTDVCIYIKEGCMFLGLIFLWWLIIYIKIWNVKHSK